MNIKKLLLFLCFCFSISSFAQFGKIKIDKKQVSAATKAVQAFTISDSELNVYIQEYVDHVDKLNPVCSVDDTDAGMRAVGERLNNIIANAPDVQDMNLDVKAYYVVDVNAFACANGSIRIFAGLMEVMSDDEILGVIGHEVGHIAHKDTKEAFKTALLTSALKDAVASSSDTAAALTDSQLGDLGEALVSAQYSQKAEYAADEYAYNFLKEAGANPQAMASALRVLQRLMEEANASGTSVINQLFSSHPDTSKRAATLDKIHTENSKNS